MYIRQVTPLFDACYDFWSYRCPSKRQWHALHIIRWPTESVSQKWTSSSLYNYFSLRSAMLKHNVR